MSIVKAVKVFLLFPVTLFASEQNIVSLDWTQALDKEYKNIAEIYNAPEKLKKEDRNKNKNSALLNHFPDLKFYKIKDGCKTIKETAFADFYWNGTIVIPTSVKNIEQHAFAHNRYDGCFIPKVKVPVSVETIAKNAFYFKKAFDSARYSSYRRSPDITIYDVKTFDELSKFATVLGEACQFVTHVAFGPEFNETTVNEGVFQNFENIQELILPETITIIGDKAFHSVNLKKITLPSQLKTIGELAFSQTQLKSIVIPDSVTTIGNYAFSNCYQLKDVQLSNNLNKIHEGTFWECEQLSTTSGKLGIAIPSTIKEIAAKAFAVDGSHSDFRRTFHINPETKISSNAFSNYDSFCIDCENIEISWDVIKQNLSPLLSQITDIVLPNTIQSISKDTLSGLTHLRLLILPRSVTQIEDDALSDLTELKNLILPASIQKVGQNNKGLEKLWSFKISNCEDFDDKALGRLREVLGEEAKYVTKLPTLTTSFAEITQDTFKGFENLNEIIIPAGVTKIGKAAFKNFTKLSSVKIPNSVQSIDEEAFSGCKSLRSIKLCEGLTKIGSNAFYGTDLYNIDIPKTVKTIGSQAFASCKRLSKAKIPASVESLNNPFTSDSIKIEISGKPDLLENLAQKLGPLCQNVVSLTCPDGIQTIKQSTFKAFHKQYPQETGSYHLYDDNISNLEKIVLPDTVTEISEQAFSNFKKLREINIPNGVTKIGNRAFANTGLWKIDLPASIQSLGTEAFSNCSQLSEVTLPEVSLAIPQKCFKDCSNLGKINSKNHGTFNLPEGITEIGYQAFLNCGSDTDYWVASKFRKVVIPSTCKSIQSYAFQDCSNLSTVEFAERNNQRSYIAGKAFDNTKIFKVQLPNGVIYTDNSFPTDIKRPDQPKEQGPQPSVEKISVTDNSVKNPSENQAKDPSAPQTPAEAISQNHEDSTENQYENPFIRQQEEQMETDLNYLISPSIQQHDAPSLDAPLPVDSPSSPSVFSKVLKWTGITVVTGICIYGAKKIYNYMMRNYFQKA